MDWREQGGDIDMYKANIEKPSTVHFAGGQRGGEKIIKKEGGDCLDKVFSIQKIKIFFFCFNQIQGSSRRSSVPHLFFLSFFLLFLPSK